jgi:hypothetical protein
MHTSFYIPMSMISTLSILFIISFTCVLSTSLGMVVLGVKRAMKGIVITLFNCRHVWSFYNSSHLLQVEIFTHLLLNKLVIKHGWLLFKDGNFSQSCCNIFTIIHTLDLMAQSFNVIIFLVSFVTLNLRPFQCDWVKVLIHQIRKNFYFTHVKLFYIFSFHLHGILHTSFLMSTHLDTFRNS